jgi:DNA polymerase-4
MAQFAERFLHIDMDAFFVEVERNRDPSLVGVPVIVGGLGRRGVVASCSYEARARGVKSAMPMGEARRLCPHGRFVPPSHGVYGGVSRQVFEVFRSFTPLVEGLSVDEAFLDIGGLRLHYETPAAVGHQLRARVRDQLSLPASVGISAVKFISKLASDDAKPDGLLVVPAGTELEYLQPMPVSRLWGVGQATRVTLGALGVECVGDLDSVPEQILVKRLGPSLAQHLKRLAAGIDPRVVDTTETVKSVSVEETYESDITDLADIERAVLKLCNRLSLRLHRSGVAGHTISLKVRFADFETVSRSETVVDPIANTPGLWDEAQSLLTRADIAGRGVRLLGIGVSGLVAVAAPRQLSLQDPQRSIAAGVVEEVRERFGEDAVLPASLLDTDDRRGPGR